MYKLLTSNTFLSLKLAGKLKVLEKSDFLRIQHLHVHWYNVPIRLFSWQADVQYMTEDGCHLTSIAQTRTDSVTWVS